MTSRAADLAECARLEPLLLAPWELCGVAVAHRDAGDLALLFVVAQLEESALNPVIRCARIGNGSAFALHGNATTRAEGATIPLSAQIDSVDAGPSGPMVSSPSTPISRCHVGLPDTALEQRRPQGLNGALPRVEHDEQRLDCRATMPSGAAGPCS